jgi:hypothetical protein
MKDPATLQALASAQAYRIDLRVYEQIGISERGNVGTSQQVEYTLLTAQGKLKADRKYPQAHIGEPLSI